MCKTRVLAAAVLFCSIMAGAAPAPAHYQLKQKYVLGGEGFWDYLTFDAAGKRLFISRGTHVMVVDPAKGSVIGDIQDTPGVHGIALAPELNKGFTSNGRENTVTVFNLKTLKETARIKLEGAENPDAILYDPASKRVFTNALAYWIVIRKDGCGEPLIDDHRLATRHAVQSRERAPPPQLNAEYIEVARSDEDSGRFRTFQSWRVIPPLNEDLPARRRDKRHTARDSGIRQFGRFSKSLL